MGVVRAGRRQGRLRKPGDQAHPESAVTRPTVNDCSPSRRRSEGSHPRSFSAWPGRCSAGPHAIAEADSLRLTGRRPGCPNNFSDRLVSSPVHSTHFPSKEGHCRSFCKSVGVLPTTNRAFTSSNVIRDTCGPLPQPAPVLGYPPQLRLPRRTGNQRGRRALESHAEGASDLRPGLSEPRRRAHRRRRVRRTLQPALAPREAGVSNATRSARGVRATSRRVAQTCVQETGCGTGAGVPRIPGWIPDSPGISRIKLWRGIPVIPAADA